MIKLREIKMLHAILTTGSVSGASKLLNVSQPAISKALSALEERLGFLLFNRIGGHLEAIPETTYLFEELEHSIKNIERLDERVRNAKSGFRNTLNIASLPGPSNFFLPYLLKNYFGLNDAPKISLNTRTTPVIRDLVSTQQVEIGVLVNPPKSSSYKVFPTPNEYVCALPEGHHLASRQDLGPKDLADEALTLTGPNHIIYQQLATAFAAEGVAFSPVHEVPYYMPALGFALSGFGISFVDTITAWSYEKLLYARGLTFKKFNPTIYDQMAVISPAIRTLPQNTKLFRDYLVDEMMAMKSIY